MLATLFFAITSLFSTLEMHVPSDTYQLVVVTTAGWDDIKGSLQCYEREDNQFPWKRVGKKHDIVVGKNGMGWGIGLHNQKWLKTYSGPIKQEGDKRSPAGLFAIGPAFGQIPENKLGKLSIPYLYLTPTMEAVDDPESQYYNQIIDSKTIENIDWQSSEKMAEIPVYELGLVVQHNSVHPKPGAGSAIFMHLWRNAESGTGGCTAMSKEVLSEILHWLESDKNPVLLQCPK